MFMSLHIRLVLVSRARFIIFKMNCDYQVCELQESPETYSVAAVPEDWIEELEDGTLTCVWPKENATRKIRLKQRPDDVLFYRYKCRILMDGGNY